tara:strand:- start:2505 stop:2744 length:240 start_codon:yes stop_codon:yes gene_type:complete
MADYYNYGKYMDWGSWRAKKRKVSPAALNYPKTKILKMLKENYVSEVVEDTKTKTKRISISPKKNPFDDWSDFDDFFQK